MSAAVLVALAVWCSVPPSARPRAHRVLLARRHSPRADPAVLAAVLVPVAAIVVLGVPWGPVVGLLVAPLVHRATGRLESRADRRRSQVVEDGLPGALDLVVAALSVGRPAGTALALAAEATDGPLGDDLRLLARRLTIASDPEPVWQSMIDDPSLAPVGRAFSRAATSGVAVSEIIAGIADELRRERSARLTELSRRVGVRTAAPLGLCFLPAFFLIGIVPTIIASFSTIAW